MIKLCTGMPVLLGTHPLVETTEEYDERYLGERGVVIVEGHVNKNGYLMIGVELRDGACIFVHRNLLTYVGTSVRV